MQVSIIFIVALLIIELYGIKFTKEPNKVLDLNTTTVLRGFFCFPIIFAHIFDNYSNRIQFEAGHYAFIGVTFFVYFLLMV